MYQLMNPLSKLPYLSVGALGAIVLAFLVRPANVGELSAEASPTALQRISATATRIAWDVFDVTESVSIANGDQILPQQASNVFDLVDDLLNVGFTGGPCTVGKRVSICGIDGRILFLIDGVRQNYQHVHNSHIYIDSALLKQVEVLRGPASAWGSGVLGGVIALATKNAADLLRHGQRFGVRLSGGYSRGQ